MIAIKNTLRDFPTLKTPIFKCHIWCFRVLLNKNTVIVFYTVETEDDFFKYI